MAGQAVGTNTAKPDVLQAAWFWKSAIDQVGAPVAPPAPPPTEPSGVPEGDLAVANTSDDGSSSKTSVIAFQLASVPAGSTIDSFKITLTIDAAGTNLNESSAPVVACLPTRLWSAVEGGSFKDAPPVNCADKSKAEIDGDTFTFDVTDIAQTWLADTNLGVAFVNDPENTTTPFQTVFKGAKSVKASLSFTPPVQTGGNDGSSDDGDGGGGGTSGGSTGGSTTGPGTVGSVGVPPAPPSIDVPLPPATTDTDPGAGQPPQVAGDTAGSPVTTVAAADPAPSAPSSAFWIAAAALALLLVTAAVVLADQRVPVPTATTTRLSRVLRDRERGLDPTIATPTTLAPREV
jgi:hypothetical protein